MNRLFFKSAKQFVLFILCVFSIQAQSGSHFGYRSLKYFGCETFKSELLNELFYFVQENKKIPGPSDLESLRRVEGYNLVLNVVNFIGDMSRSQRQMSEQKVQEILEMISSLDVGDRSTSKKIMVYNKFQELFNSSVNFTENENCQQSLIKDQFGGAPLRILESGENLNVWGARKSFATSYQSCDVLNYESLTRSTPDVLGVEIVGNHSDGVGKKRVLKDLNLFLNSNGYLQFADQIQPKPECFRVRETPLIYDYGGKPYVTKNNELDFFKNAGSGTQTLGIDCSGLVFSSLAASGLRLEPGRPLRATMVYGVSARMFMNPKQNGLSCFDYVVLSETDSLKAGDVIASTGHIVIVESVGDDPFGIRNIKSESECENVSIENFDFNILQSSPVKNGIGINKIKAKEYLQDTSMKEGLLAYAKLSCQSFYRKTRTQPKGLKVSIVRHSLSADCLGASLKLNKEECVQSCLQ